MLFVDGENWTIRGQEVAASAGVTLTEGRFFIPNVFLWPPGSGARNVPEPFRGWANRGDMDELAVRSYYYGTVVGDTSLVDRNRATVHRAGFDPRIFKKEKRTRPTKAVDISLATDLLGHATADHFDLAVLLAGDADYIPLIEAVKRLGKRVWVGFFDEFAGQGMKLVPDFYFTLNEFLLDPWRKANPSALADP